MELVRTVAQSSRLRILDETGSTNDVLAGLAANGDEPHLSTVVTLNQTGGRGRLGRVWVGPKDKSLAVSVLLRPRRDDGSPLPASRFGWLPLIAGVAMSSSIDALVGDGRTGLKWPNDVQVDGRKVCGILAELQPSGGVVVGAGVNLTLGEEELPVPTAISLALAGVTKRGDELVDLVVGHYLSVLAEMVETLAAAGSDADAGGIRRRVSEWCRTLGREVRVSLPDGADLFGVATGIDEAGRLLVRSGGNQAVLAVAAGDVTHLRYE
ncbi:MAG: biotin--[acetyl-CoA-carboxylase] ligase [Galbitalea sp.]